jgi:hypothetical protein
MPEPVERGKAEGTRPWQPGPRSRQPSGSERVLNGLLAGGLVGGFLSWGLWDKTGFLLMDLAAMTLGAMAGAAAGMILAMVLGVIGASRT